MKESLRTKLHNLIKSRNGQIVTLNEIEFLCKKENYKISNAERRLRPSESPNVAPYMKDGAIIGYYWKAITSGSGMTADEFMVKFASKPKEVKNVLF